MAFPSFFFFVFASVISAWWLSLMLAATASGVEEGGDCSPKKCGDLTISPPFWINRRPQKSKACGFRDFLVDCNDSTGVATLPSTTKYGFDIFNISYGERTMLVLDFHKVVDLTDSTNCHIPIRNTSAKLGILFKISPANRNLVFYNCTAKPLAAAERRELGLVETRCRNNSFARLGGPYDSQSNLDEYSLEGCSTTFLPVLLKPGGPANATGYLDLMRGGFLTTWELPSETSGHSNNGRRIILIVLTAAAATLLFPCIYVLIWHRKGKTLQYLHCTKTSRTSERNIESLIVSYGSLAPTRYKYSEVTKITSLFNNKLGEGGYGVVFKGKLHDGRLVAVKFLHDSEGNGEEFMNEVMSIGRTSHVNVVSLFGFCLEGSKRALLYEYMPNGSLDKYIYSENPKAILGWEEIYRIAIGIARGLEYLHHGCNTRIIHFDIKPQNILLDQEFCPKIADFGLAKSCRAQESKISMIGARGTIEFIAPEVMYKTFGVVSTKSDVYSYGMMLLEMVGGRRNVRSMVEKSSEKYFPDWIYDHFALDDGLKACEVTSEFEQIAKRMTLIGLWCVQVLPMHRPTITQALDMFDRSLDELEMPPKQNFLELLEHPVHRLSEESTSFTRHTNATEALSDVLKVEETSLVNLKNLDMTTNSAKR
ncbi:hypothetical protein ABZP36_015492 [Zizania latifolia]